MQPYQKNSLHGILLLTICIVLLSTIRSVVAAGYKITTNTVGAGQITIAPDQSDYATGDVITMTATADPGWQFSEWQINYSEWWDMDWHYRLPLTVQANGYERFDGIAEVDINFSNALFELGQYGYLSLDSLRVIEVNANGTILDTAVAFQFDQAGDFDAVNNAWGTLILQLTNTTPAEATRFYDIYFDIDSNAFTAPIFTSQITVTNTVDEGQDSFQIDSTSATYFFQKEAGGFSSLVDITDNDWIGFNPYPDSGGAGEFRGIPNLLPPENGGYFHPGKTNANSYLGQQGPLKATINSYIPNTNWATRWEFYPNYAKMTVTGVEAAPYWFLYEGTPGGTFDVDSDFVMRSDGTQTPANTPWSNDLSGDEWVYFGDPVAERSLFITNSPGDEHIDSYFPLGSLMTVFGFGRFNLDAYLQNSGQQFVIGLVERTELTPVSATINSASQQLVIEKDVLQFQETAVYHNNPITHTITGHTTVTAVFELNQAPLLATIPDQTTKSGQTLTFNVSATDPNDTIPTLTAINLPDGADFLDNGDGTAVFNWTPSAADIGQYQITFIATDAELSTEQTITITVIPCQIWLPVLFNSNN